jgi:hypothetical protein
MLAQSGGPGRGREGRGSGPKGGGLAKEAQSLWGRPGLVLHVLELRARWIRQKWPLSALGRHSQYTHAFTINRVLRYLVEGWEGPLGGQSKASTTYNTTNRRCMAGCTTTRNLANRPVQCSAHAVTVRSSRAVLQP